LRHTRNIARTIKRYPDFNSRPCFRGGCDVNGAAYCLDSLSHACEPQTIYFLPGIEADTIVGDPQQDFFVIGLQLNPHVLGLAVLNYVMQYAKGKGLLKCESPKFTAAFMSARCRPTRGWRLKEQAALKLEFANGSRIVGIPEGADQIRSFHPWGLL